MIEPNNPLLRLASAPANTPTRPFLQRLPLVPEHRRLLPNLDRHLSAVDPALLRVLGDLAEGRAPWPLLLWGPPGRGKSCAALALADITDTAGYWTCEELADFAMQHRGDEVDAEFARIGGKHLAILDELGTRLNAGELAYKTVKRFADVRETESRRVGIYISNVAPHELAALYDDRLASRLLGGTIYELCGQDRRRAAR